MSIERLSCGHYRITYPGGVVDMVYRYDVATTVHRLLMEGKL